jgi:hypothetical protein
MSAAITPASANRTMQPLFSNEHSKNKVKLNHHSNLFPNAIKEEETPDPSPVNVKWKVTKRDSSNMAQGKTIQSFLPAIKQFN